MKHEGFSRENDPSLQEQASRSKERKHVYRIEAAPLETKAYKTKEGVPVEVSCKTFFPIGDFTPEEASISGEYKEGEGLRFHEGVKNPNLGAPGSSHEGYIMLPGVGIEAGGESGQDFGEAFARASKKPTYVITTRFMGAMENSLYEEAGAIAQFLKEKGISHATVAGNSEGGDKAIDLVSILQKEKNVSVDGLALLGSVGLADQTPEELGKQFFFKDPMKTTREAIRNLRKKGGFSTAKKAAALSGEVSGGIAGYLMKIMKQESGWGNKVRAAMGRVGATLEGVSKANPRIKEIRVPVAIISGSEDEVSKFKDIVPPLQKDGEGNYVDTRDESLRENIFTSSPAVKVFTPEKFGGHALSILRAQEVADVTVRAFQQMQKDEGLEVLKKKIMNA